MREEAKRFILTTARIPGLFIMLFTSCLMWVLAWFDLRLKMWDWQLIQWTLPPLNKPEPARVPPATPEPAQEATLTPQATIVALDEGLPTVGAILAFMARLPNDRLTDLREVFEGTPIACKAREDCFDRHLYAVKTPNKAENVRRIENVLRAMDPAELDDYRARVKKTIGL